MSNNNKDRGFTGFLKSSARANTGGLFWEANEFQADWGQQHVAYQRNTLIDRIVSLLCSFAE
jgi:hypothetical protein